VSVNLSVHQFAEQAQLVTLVAETLRDTGLPAQALELEITESVFTKQPEIMIEVLKELRALGPSIAVDDFGTGYSSLAYIRRFPVTTLKVDRAFVIEIDRARESRAIVGAILGLARELALHTVAEGVETEEQAEALAALGCAELQGYVISKPLEAPLARDFAVSHACKPSHNDRK
jgi:EAL domain-containing protein (putative c-di-GMP-specific phosphodiesterase class I)